MGNICCTCCKNDCANHMSDSLEQTFLLEEKIAVVQSDFPSPDSHTILRKSDRVKILNKINDDWLMVSNVATGASGQIPRNFLEFEDSIEAKPWYFGDVSRLEVETQLLTQSQPDGTFLIRKPNTAKDSAWILNVKYSNRQEACVAHYKIKTDSSNKYYISPLQIFPTIDALIRYYQDDTLGQLNARLTNPCTTKQSPQQYDVHPYYVNNLEIARHELNFLELLGSGFSSRVYRAMHKNNVEVAVKQLQSKPNFTQFLEEINIMKMFRHKNLVNLYGICTMAEPILIIQEYIQNGSLVSYTKKVKLEPMDKIYIAFQVADGMSYLEKKKVIHRDLAARNVLIGENHRAKICDFGLSRYSRSGVYDIQNFNQNIPVRWTAPEAFSENRLSSKSDVWSFGILMIELYTNCEPPYKDIKQNCNVLNYILTGGRIDKPAIMPPHIYNVVRSCWELNPDDRPNFHALKHYFDQFIL